MSDLEGQARPVGLSDVDALAIADVDHRYTATVDVDPITRAVVDRHPPALIESEQQMGARDRRVRDAHVGAQVASNDDLVACRETALRPVAMNRQHRRRGPTHQISIR
jgi:hypothetical protein